MTGASFLHSLMTPKSIAILGASNNPMKMGTMHALSILNDGFTGNFYPIHPTEETILGHKAYQSPRDLPETPDLAIFVLPAKHLLPLFEAFGEIGTKYAIIITAGYKEIGTEGARQEAELLTAARKYGIRFIGPNCMGLINREASLNTTLMPMQGKPGKLGFISQSGTYVAQTTPYLEKRGIHYSKAFSLGNEADVNIIDVLEYLGEDDQTRAISMYIETIRDVPRFLEVAGRITPHKPVIAQYVGGSEAGARAGLSHTGALAGKDYLYEGLFRQAGVIRVSTVEELYNLGMALAEQPRIQGNRIAILTNSGGPGSAMADTCERYGCQVPPFSQALQDKIRPLVPSHAPCGNPVDLTFSMDAALMTDTLADMIMKSGEVDGLIMHGAMSTGFMKAVYPNVSQMMPDLSLSDMVAQMQKDLSETVKRPFENGIPITLSSFFDREDQYTRDFEDNGIPVFDGPEKAARAMAAMAAYHDIRKLPAQSRPELPEAAQSASEIIKKAINNQQNALDEFAAKQLLAAYGIPVPAERVVNRPEELAEALKNFSFPLVLKANHPEILHKTEKGLVFLNIETPEAARRAYTAIQDRAGDSVPVIIGEMIQGEREFLAGVADDAQFGQCVAFGVGGVLTEALTDIVYRVAPITEAEAVQMLSDIRTTKLLDAYRGMPAVDKAAMATLISRLSRISFIHPEIREIDINPIIIAQDSPMAADALVLLK
ncbi:MAG: acetate--CoA ligase family protein [Desulfobacterales bacterium]|nr:acetate--CoA ligase family protein [Desulfobacterales bacterium]